MAKTITISRKAFAEGVQKKALKFALWKNDHFAPVQNQSNTVLCTSADSKGFLDEGLLHRVQYMHSLKGFEKQNVPMFLTSQRAFEEVKEQANCFDKKPKLLISNGGSVASDERGNFVVDERMDQQAVQALNKVLETSKSGVVCVGTKHGTFSHPSKNKLTNVFDPFLKTKFNEEEFERAVNPRVAPGVTGTRNLGNVKNLTFQIYSGATLKDTGFGIGSSFLDRLFCSKKGTFRVNFKFAVLVPRNPLRRKKIRGVDFVNQEKVTKSVLNGILESPLKDNYLDSVDVTLTKNGLEFLPKGVNKHSSAKKFCYAKHLDPTNLMLHGDDFDDFFLPVNLREIENAKQKAEAEGKPFDAFESFLKLSKPAFENQEFFVQALGYKLDVNKTFASSAIEKKFLMASDDFNNKLLEQVKQTLFDKAKDEQDKILENKVKAVEAKYAQKISEQKSLVKKTDLKLDMEAEKKELQKESDETLNAIKQEIDKKSIKDLPPDYLARGDVQNGNMIALKNRFSVFSRMKSAILASTSASVHAPTP